MTAQIYFDFCYASFWIRKVKRRSNKYYSNIMKISFVFIVFVHDDIGDRIARSTSWNHIFQINVMNSYLKKIEITSKMKVGKMTSTCHYWQNIVIFSQFGVFVYTMSSGQNSWIMNYDTSTEEAAIKDEIDMIRKTILLSSFNIRCKFHLSNRSSIIRYPFMESCMATMNGCESAIKLMKYEFYFDKA